MSGKYAKGANFERQVKDFLEEEGFLVVRSAGSHTISDLVAINPGPVVWLIQCKTDGRLKPDEREALLKLERLLDIVPMLAYKEKGKIKLEKVKSKEPDFHYEVQNGRFVKIGNY